MRWLPGLGALSLEPWDQIGLTSLFSGVHELQRADRPNVRLLRSPTAVLVLSFDERDGRYHEVPRAQLLEQCLVLAHEHIAEVVARHLAVYARPGFERLSRAALPQLPGRSLGSPFANVVLRAGRRRVSPSTPKRAVASPHDGNRLSQAAYGLAREPGMWPTRGGGCGRAGDADDRSLALKSPSWRGSLLPAHFADGARSIWPAALCPRATTKRRWSAVALRPNGRCLWKSKCARLRSADHPRPVGVRRDLGLGFDLRPRSVGFDERPAADRGPASVMGSGRHLLAALPERAQLRPARLLCRRPSRRPPPQREVGRVTREEAKPNRTLARSVRTTGSARRLGLTTTPGP